jgi:hypothetical protein
MHMHFLWNTCSHVWPSYAYAFLIKHMLHIWPSYAYAFLMKHVLTHLAFIWICISYDIRVHTSCLNLFYLSDNICKNMKYFNLLTLYFFQSRNSWVGELTIWIVRQDCRDSIANTGKRFLFNIVQAGSSAHQTYYPVFRGVTLPAYKLAGVWILPFITHLVPTQTIPTAIPPLPILMAWY